jgi:hypothetical protein
MQSSEERTRVSAKTTERLAPGPASGARSSQRDSKSPKLTLREHITLFGCAVLVVGSLVVDLIREWRKA